MRFEIKQGHSTSGPELTARLQAVGAEFRGMIKTILEEAAEEGRRVAQAGAPRSGILRHNDGARISDSIQVTPVRFAAGGAGGGGFYEVSLSASTLIAPQLRYVLEGTANRGAGKIYPARGNVLAIDKGGEGVHFRRWVHGQAPQTRWWEDAQDAVSASVEAGIESMHLGNP